MRASVRTERNFSPARKVLSMTLPSLVRRSLVRTNAPPLPGLTCWNSTTLKIVPSTSMWLPFLNWLVEITTGEGSEAARRRHRADERDSASCTREDGRLRLARHRHSGVISGLRSALRRSCEAL